MQDHSESRHPRAVAALLSLVLAAVAALTGP
jgi:hypothetical protein